MLEFYFVGYIEQILFDVTFHMRQQNKNINIRPCVSVVAGC